jgi:UDP-3-O-[3-hydroxymyristoyl] glucosamine N-acyltransferase
MNTAFRLKHAVSGRWLSERLGLELLGENRQIRALCPLTDLDADSLSFALPGRSIEHLRAGTIFGVRELGGNGVSVISAHAPRLEFIRAQHLLEQNPGFEVLIPPAEVHPAARVAPSAVIEDGVRIGEGTIIGPAAVIRTGTHIGRHCEVQSGAVIGDEGFGFERDDELRPLRMIHLGRVQIGDHVLIGANTCVARGALDDTVIEDYVKINNLVHVAHNCHIGRGTIIGACADLCGSLVIGANCWIAPNCSIRQKLSIGEGATIGIGAVVVKDVAAGAMVYGNPAKLATSKGA